MDKASVLAALYNASKPLGMGFMSYDPEAMQPDEAAELLKQGTYFDYLKGRVMKLDLRGSLLDPGLYDRDNGEGAAERAIEAMRKSGDVNSPEIASANKDGVRQSAATTRATLGKSTTISGPVVELGLAELADELGPKINRAIDHANQ